MPKGYRQEIPPELVQKWVNLYKNEGLTLKAICERFRSERYGYALVSREIRKALNLEHLDRKGAHGDGWCGG